MPVLLLVREIIGWLLISLAAYLAIFNLYTLLIHPLVMRSRRKAGREARNVSPVPVVGTLLLFLALLISPHEERFFWAALLTAIADTAGIPWMIVWLPIVLACQWKGK